MLEGAVEFSPSECPICGRSVRGIYRSGGRQHENGPVQPWLTQLQPCGHVLAGGVGGVLAPADPLAALDPDVRQVVDDTVEAWQRKDETP